MRTDGRSAAFRRQLFRGFSLGYGTTDLAVGPEGPYGLPAEAGTPAKGAAARIGTGRSPAFRRQLSRGFSPGYGATAFVVGPEGPYGLPAEAGTPAKGAAARSGTKRNHGFTLLELIISTTLLLTILGVLGVAVNRAHTIRRDSTRRTRLLYEGRAVLELLSDELQNVVGSNLWLSTANESNDDGSAVPDDRYRSYGSANNAIQFIKSRPLTNNYATATAELPLEEVYYFVYTNGYSRLPGYALYRGSAAQQDAINVSSINRGTTAERYEIDRFDWNDLKVTNIVAGPGTTLLPHSYRGETINIPITTSSLTRFRRWETSSDAWLDVEPEGEDGLTNRVNATVVFTIEYDLVTTNTIWRPESPVVTWPDQPLLTVSTGRQHLVRYNYSERFFDSGLYTNTPALADFANNHVAYYTTLDETDAPVEHELLLAVWTGSWQTATNGVAAVTNTPLLTAWGVTNWSYATLPLEWPYSNLVEIADGVTTNSFGVSADQQYGEFYHAWQLMHQPLPELTNMPWRLGYSLTNDFFFPAPETTNGVPWVPLELNLLEVSEGGGSSSEWAMMSSYGQTALGSSNNLPFVAQTWERNITTTITNEFSSSNLVAIVHEQVTTTVTNWLTTLLPATMIEARHYDYISGSRQRLRGAIRDSDETTWVPVVLQDDFKGAAETIQSLWLKHGKRSGSDYGFKSETLYGLTGVREGEPEAGYSDPRMIIDGVAACYFQPLCFRKVAGVAQLEPWQAGDSEEPVAVDIYLELIDPAVGRRAANIGDETKRKSFVERHVLRLTKRVLLQTHNRWRAP